MARSCTKVCDLGHIFTPGLSVRLVRFCTAAFLYSSEPQKLCISLGFWRKQTKIAGKLGLAKLFHRVETSLLPVGWEGMSLAPLHDAAFPSPFVP